MKLIVGLGNPGDIYTDSRHNIGFSVVKTLAGSYKVSLKRDARTFSFSARIRIGRESVIFAKPLTFMNLSGSAVTALVKKYRIELSDLLIICDDLDLELGRLRLRPSGSNGGHRGLDSLINSLGSNEFARLRIGIGRPPKSGEASEYVLSPFLKKERTKINQAIEEAVECCQSWVTQGTSKTMNLFNKRSN